MSKGSKRRPKEVSNQTWDSEYDRIFGPKQKVTPPPSGSNEEKSQK